MALTTLVLASNRFLSEVFLTNNVGSVAADAAILERFQLPTGFGNLALSYVEAVVGNFSGAYVAPAPAYDGLKVSIVDGTNTTVVDSLGSGRFVHGYSGPSLFVTFELFRRTVLRQGEQLRITAPILAGAGVTVAVTCALRGIRLNNS